ncbi:hypothetical protein IMZ29_00875 [Achromobacter sp. GG226]|nr:hypothetical protein [Verticiella sp. GG226]MBU4609156.1 hypothetical protein [Verticiella sp. GG226]
MRPLSLFTALGFFIAAHFLAVDVATMIFAYALGVLWIADGICHAIRDR